MIIAKLEIGGFPLAVPYAPSSFEIYVTCHESNSVVSVSS
jgi:hypothetical protein